MLYDTKERVDFRTLLREKETNNAKNATVERVEAEENLKCDTFDMDFGPLHWTNIQNNEDSETLAYHGAGITEDQGLRILMSLRSKTKISDAAFGHVLDAIDQLLPQGHKLPPSNFLFRQKTGTSDIEIIKHTFCRDHRVYVGPKSSGEVCGTCQEEAVDTALERFFTFNLIGTWRRLLEVERVQKLKNEGSPVDQLGITKSKRFQEVRLEVSGYTMSFFMDAMRVSNSKSNTQSITIISFVCDQIPPPHRFNFARPAMIYVGEVAVDSNILLKPFIDQCIQLSEKGVEHYIDAEKAVSGISKVHTMTCISDATAKCEIQADLH